MTNDGRPTTDNRQRSILAFARHPREGGDPETSESCLDKALDPRLRGDDEQKQTRQTDSRLPTPDSRFPIPDSQTPALRPGDTDDSPATPPPDTTAPPPP